MVYIADQKEIVSVTRTGAIIVQVKEMLFAACVRCRHCFQWNTRNWECSNEECGKIVENVDESVRTSMIDADKASITRLTMWAACWLDEPTSGVRVIVTRD